MWENSDGQLKKKKRNLYLINLKSLQNVKLRGRGNGHWESRDI